MTIPIGWHADDVWPETEDAAGARVSVDAAPATRATEFNPKGEDMTPEAAIVIAWVLWLASWLAAALWSDPAAKRPGFGRESSYWIAQIAGVYLVFFRFDRVDDYRLWHLGPGIDWVLAALAVAGLLFTWWARLYLGRLWSSSVTRKAHHRVIDTGPYAIVRHPIYTGIIAAIVATAIVKGTFSGIVGALLITYGYWIKARLEERFLREELGPEAYDTYRRRVPMLIPFGPKSAQWGRGD